MHHLLLSTPLLSFLHESALSADSCRKKKHLHCSYSSILPEPSFPSPPNVFSSNICPAMKHSSMFTHNKSGSYVSHASASGCKRERQGHYFVEERLFADLSRTPSFSLNSFTFFCACFFSTQLVPIIKSYHGALQS